MNFQLYISKIKYRWTGGLDGYSHDGIRQGGLLNSKCQPNLKEHYFQLVFWGTLLTEKLEVVHQLKFESFYLCIWMQFCKRHGTNKVACLFFISNYWSEIPWVDPFYNILFRKMPTAGSKNMKKIVLGSWETDFFIFYHTLPVPNLLSFYMYMNMVMQKTWYDMLLSRCCSSCSNMSRLLSYIWQQRLLIVLVQDRAERLKELYYYNGCYRMADWVSQNLNWFRCHYPLIPYLSMQCWEPFQ